MVPDDSLRFSDRREAGAALAAEIHSHLVETGITDRPLVLGMSPGGVPVAAEVARLLTADLDVIVVDRIGLPWQADFAVGALADNGPPVIDHDALTRANLCAGDLNPTVTALRAALSERARHYRQGRPAAPVAGRTLVVVDDGMQSGLRARAALRALHAALPAHLVFATPVCAAEVTGVLAVEADALIHVRCPCCFSSTGLWYRDIHELSDDEIVAALRPARELAGAR